jgi:hypothetical protein
MKSNKQRTSNWVATLPTLTAEEDVLALRAIKSAVQAINETNKITDGWAKKGYRKRFNSQCEEVALPRYRVAIRARGPKDGYKYGYGGYLKVEGGTRFDVYIYERR